MGVRTVMMNHELQTLIQDVLDGTATPEQRQRLETTLANDETARARYRELESVFTSLRSVGPSEAPAGLRDSVLGEIARQRSTDPRLRDSSSAFERGLVDKIRDVVSGRAGFGSLISEWRPGMKKQSWVILGTIVVVGGIGIVAVSGLWPPKNGVEGTIGGANRYHAPQIAESDVQLGDTDLQAFIQTDTFHRMAIDPEFRAAVKDAAFRSALSSREFAMVAQKNEFAHLATTGLIGLLGRSDFQMLAKSPDFQRAAEEALQAWRLERAEEAGKALSMIATAKTEAERNSLAKAEAAKNTLDKGTLEMIATAKTEAERNSLAKAEAEKITQAARDAGKGSLDARNDAAMVSTEARSNVLSMNAVYKTEIAKYPDLAKAPAFTELVQSPAFFALAGSQDLAMLVSSAKVADALSNHSDAFKADVAKTGLAARDLMALSALAKSDRLDKAVDSERAATE
jgi:hypothetical protein